MVLMRGTHGSLIGAVACPATFPLTRPWRTKCPQRPALEPLASEMSVYPYPTVTAPQLATSVKPHLKRLGA